MKREVHQISADGKTVRITVADERWYIKDSGDGEAIEYPSATWISSHYPKGIGYMQWLAAQGWDNAKRIMESAGDRGSKVHHAVSSLLLGNELKMDDKLMNSDGEPEDITSEEWEAIMSFVAWHGQVKPKSLENEITVFNDEFHYAGTADYVCMIEEERWLIDFKTSKDIWPSHEIQIASYSHALPKELKPDKLAILQLGYKRNKAGFKFTEIPDQFDLFLAAKAIWQKECGSEEIHKKDYPVTLSLS